MITAHNKQLEWDHSSYYRKFHGTLAYVKVGDAIPSWRWIAAITDTQFAYEDPRAKPIGQIVCEVNGCVVPHDPEKYPILQFLYHSIFPGVYRSKKDAERGYFITKRHLKSYKIGLSDETHSVRNLGAAGYDRVSKDVDLDSPVDSYWTGKNFEVFSKKLVRVGTSLFADGDSIGFMEKGQCVVRNPAFVPVIKPFLEDKWQIVS